MTATEAAVLLTFLATALIMAFPLWILAVECADLRGQLDASRQMVTELRVALARSES